MEEIAIKVDNVSKTFKLPHEKRNSIKSLFVNIFRGKRTYEHQRVLNKISFEVKKGEFFGVVGRNGSGKSTMLKLLAGIYTPDKGGITTNGTLTPFIELGVGFNPELTGRENVFLNGALLGFNRKQMRAMYNDIVSFAELERFMDQKLKNYSSGMQVRLAFSIAIRAESDILVLDEVLAVGDAAFQKKCLDYFRTLKKNKQTVVLVSHSMDTVEQYCDKAILIDLGRVIDIGPAIDIAAQYEQINLLSQIKDIEDGRIMSEGGDATIVNIQLNGSTKDLILKEHTSLRLDVTYKVERNIRVAGSMSIIRSDGTFLANINTRKESNIKISKKGDTAILTCTFHTQQFLNGTYSIDTAIYEGESYLDRRYNAIRFTVAVNDKSTGKGGLINLAANWEK